MAASDSKPRSSAEISVLQRSTLGPILIGLIVGGVPLAIAFSRLGGRLVSAEFLRFALYLTPIPIIVTAIGTIWATNRGWRELLRRALLTSLSACIPLPLTVSCVLMWRFEYDLFSWSGPPVLLAVLLVWSLVVTLLSWLLALAFSANRARFGIMRRKS
jgi:hypothetical protein